MSKHSSFRDTVAGEMIRLIEDGTSPWQKPWKGGVANQRPFNPGTGKDYRGINSFWLEMAGHEDPRWLTFKQAKELGAYVQKGSKSRQIEYWQWTEEKPLRDENGKPVRDKDGLVQKQTVRLDRPRVFYANVFNGEQIDGLEPYTAPDLSFNPIENAEAILKASGVAIHNDQNDRAYYDRLQDGIHMPHPAAFESPYEYYSTALHEIGHATGAEHRMIREKGPFGSELYAKEELIVEMASYMASRELGLGHYPDRHASYVESWLGAIKEDQNFLFQAAASSEKIKTWIMEPEQRQELEKQTQLTFKVSKKQEVESSLETQTINPTQERVSIPLKPSHEEAFKRVLESNAVAHDGKTFVVDGEWHPIPVAGDVGKEWTGKYRLMPGDVVKGEFHNQLLNTTVTWDSKSPTLTSEELIKGFKETAKEICAKRNDLDRASAKNERDKKGSSSMTEKHEKAENQPLGITSEKRSYLAVPFEEKNEAKDLGAKWDRKARSWYAPKGTDLKTFEKWSVRDPVVEKPQLDPVTEFADFLASAGLKIDGPPVMDGTWQRVSLAGEEKKKNGSYRGFIDDVPNGHAHNYKTDETVSWKAQGAALTQEEKALLQARAAEKKLERDLDLSEKRTKAAKVSFGIWMNTKEWADQNNSSYLKDKNVKGYGVKINKRGDVIIPLRDIDGRIHSLQTIRDGNKRFTEKGRQEGLFHAIDPKRELRSKVETVLIAEGYSTGATLHEATGKPVVVAFNAGNLKPVAEQIQKAHPNANILIMGDNDHHLLLKPPFKNVGEEKALQAAKAVGGFALIPELNDKEKERGLTDWNDISAHRGLETASKTIRKTVRQCLDQTKNNQRTAAMEL